MRKVLFLTGAGISAESGISTFRDSGGLWENHDVMEVCSAAGFRKNRALVLDFYDGRRKELENVRPNAAHLMIASLQKEYPNKIVNLTQNVDDLFEKAGCPSVIHLHGELTKARCESCGNTVGIGYGPLPTGMACPVCGRTSMRHHIVMFGEAAPNYALLHAALAQAGNSGGMLVVIGTSGLVLPVDEYARMVGHSILNNLEESPELDAGAFSRVLYEKASLAAPAIDGLVRAFLDASPLAD